MIWIAALSSQTIPPAVWGGTGVEGRVAWTKAGWYDGEKPWSDSVSETDVKDATANPKQFGGVLLLRGGVKNDVLTGPRREDRRSAELPAIIDAQGQVRKTK